MNRGELRRGGTAIFILAIAILAVIAISTSASQPPTEQVSLTNMPPQWVGESTKFTIPVNKQFILDLTKVFIDPEGLPLTFIATSTEQLAVNVDETILKIVPEPGFIGERTIVVVASDGTKIASKRIKIEVGRNAPSQPAPVILPVLQTSEQQPEVQPPAVQLPVFVTQETGAVVDPGVEEALKTDSEVKVIIVLRNSMPVLSASSKEERKQALESIRSEVKSLRQQLIGRFSASGAGIHVLRQYDTLSAVGMSITQQGLDALKASPLVDKIVLNRKFTTDLSDSVPLINATAVWGIVTTNGTNLTGIGESICIIDTGADLNHSAFANKIIGGYDFINSDNSPQDDSPKSHGTHTAGIAGANASFVHGVAPDANLVPVKVCDAGNSCDGLAILSGIDYCNNNSVSLGISVISASLGDNSQYNSSTCPTDFDSLFDVSASLGIIPVFASGNNGFTNGISYPACSPTVISVGSSSKGDVLDGFTNRGAGMPDVLAPGNGITSSIIGGGTGSLTGTSMATPHVSGAIAIIQQNQKSHSMPILSLSEMRQLLQTTGVNVSGFKRINVYDAILAQNENLTINESENSISNSIPPKAKIIFKETMIMTGIESCINLSYNFASIDSINCPQFNRSARIIFEGLTWNISRPLRNNQPCGFDICQNRTQTNGTFAMDVTEFSNYTVQDAAIASCPVTINESSTLTNDVSSDVTCITINASNITFDCLGRTIIYGNAGGANSFGVNISGVLGAELSNVTVQNCNIRKTTPGGMGGFGIELYRTTDSVITNNNISTFGDGNNHGIDVYISVGNRITSNRVYANGTASNNWGLYIQSGSSNNVIANNTVYTNGSGANMGVFITSSNSNNLSQNTFVTRGPSGTNYGILISFANWNIMADNSIFTTDGSDNYGIFVRGSTNNTLSNNTISTNGTSVNHGIILNGSNNNILVANNISTQGSASYGIYITISNSSQVNKTYLNNPAQWIYLDVGTINNFTNTTFAMPDGSINIPDKAQFNGTQNVNKTKLNITSNKAFLNSTSLSFLNTSAIITIYGITAVNPEPQVDWNDTGNYENCPADVCTELNYSGGTYVFNATHFTGYRTYDASAITSCPVTINSSATLTQSLASATTCITIGNDSVVLDCNGFNISYAIGGASDANGVLANKQRNISVINCNIKDMSPLGDYGPAINFSYVNDSTIANNNITANGSSYNYGIYVLNGSRNMIANNSIDAFGTSGYNYGIYIYRDSSGNNITNNRIRTNSSDYGTGVRIEIMSSDNSVIFNNISTIAGTGVYSDQNSFRNNITSNKINVFTNTGIVLTDRYGIWVKYADNTTVNNNTVKTDHTTSVIAQYSSGIAITGNNVTTLAYALAGATGMSLSDINSSIIANNTLFTDSSGGVTVLSISSSAYNKISENNFTTNRTGSTGISLTNVLNLMNNISENSIIITQGGSNKGISVSDAVGANNTYEGNNIAINSRDGTSYGIYLNSGINSTYARNNINVTGNSSGNAGIYISRFLLSASGNYFVGNNITTNGTNDNHGIAIFLNADNNTFTANSISTRGNYSYGIFISSSNNNVFTKTQLNNTVQWINTTGTEFNNFTNTTFTTQNGNINLPFLVQINGTADISTAKLNITNNKAFLNSTNLTFFNTTGIITLYGLIYIAPRSQVDWNDTSNYENCPADVCTELNYSGGTYVFNVTHFTSYIAAEGGDVITSCPITVNESSVLGSDITSTTTCILLNNSNIVLDCQGYTITYDTLGGDNAFGIVAENFKNLQVRNCNIKDIAAGGSKSSAINFSRVNDSMIFNNNITANGTTKNAGINIEGDSVGNVIDSNNITVFGSSQNWGIAVNYYLSTFANGSLNITNNHITADSTGSNSGIYISRGEMLGSSIANNNILIRGAGGSNNGIMLSMANSTTVANNTISANGTLSNTGIEVTLSNNNNIENNSISTKGTSTNNYGLSISNCVSNSIIANVITTNCSECHGIVMNSSDAANLFNLNNISTINGSDIDSYGILLSNSNATMYNTLLNNTGQWIYTGLMFASSPAYANFINLTFATPNGSIKFPGTVRLNDSVFVQKSRLFVSANRAFVNSVALQGLNTSAVITLYGITFTDPLPRVDWNEDGTYENCPANVCTELSYSGEVYVFNVSHFTYYMSAETPISNVSNLTMVKIDSPDPVNVSSNLTYQINISITGNGTAYNTTVNDTYPNEIIYLTAVPTPLAGTNNTWILGNLSQGTNFSINITVLVLNITNGTVINNTVNVTFQNETSALLSAIATASTTVNNPLVLNDTNITITKTDLPDPVNSSWNLTYQINISVTGNGTVYNVTVNDTYPLQVIYLASQPTLLAGTNNTWILGNLTQGTNFSINITVLVLNITNGSVINNTVNVTFQNETSALLSAIATASTTVLNPPFFNNTNITGCPATINESSILNNSVSSNTTCITIGADNLTLDCKGYEIRFNGNGGNNVAGITSFNRKNITIKNCLIRDINSSGSNAMAINLTLTPNSNILNNTIQLNGSSASYGIYDYDGSHGALIANNTITCAGGSSVYGILPYLSNNSIVLNNTVTVNSTTDTIGIYVSNTINTTIAYNYVMSTATFYDAKAITFAQNYYSLVENNTFEIAGANDTSYGIYSISINSTIAHNSVIVTGGMNHTGIRIASYENLTGNTINVQCDDCTGLLVENAISQSAYNNITATGYHTYGIYGNFAVANIDNTLLNDTSNWIKTANAATILNLTNTTFATSYGQIYYPWLVNLTAEKNINRSRLDISSLYAYVNSTNITALNTSAVIKLYGVTFVDPKPIVSWADDGGYADCPITVCTELSYLGNVYTFNTTHFTAYMASENSTVITSCPVTINESASMSGNLTANNSCVMFGNDNMTLDCNNNTIFYNALGNSYSSAITASGRNNITVINCILRDINSSGSVVHAINFTRTNSSRIENNTIITNGTDNNYGIELMLNSDYNQINRNNITSVGTTNDDYGIRLFSSARNNITGNTIKTGGSIADYGISIESTSTNNTFNYNNISTAGDTSYGIYISLSTDNRFNATLLNDTSEWLYNDVTSSTRLSNTTFAMPNGSINLPNTITLSTFFDISKAKLNVTYNKAFLNSSNLTALNTTGIITVYGINYTSPLPSVDFTDANTFVHCPPGICTAIGYNAGTYSYIVAHFTKFSTAWDSNITNSTILDSNITNCTIINSTIINSSKSNCTIINSYIINSTNNNTVIIDTNETNSRDNNTFVDDSIIIDSTKLGSRINNSNITNSTIIDSNVTNSTVVHSNETNSTNINATVDHSIIIDTTKINTIINNSNITNTTLIGTVVINSTVNNSNLTNCTLTNATLGFGVTNSSCNYTNYVQPEPTTPTPPGPGPQPGGGGGGGGGGVRWKRNITSTMPILPCVENWNCEEWSRCEGNTQSRICVDLNKCNSNRYVPQIDRSCGPERILSAEPKQPEPEKEQPAEMPAPVQPLAQAVANKDNKSAALAYCTAMPVFIDSVLILLAVLALVSLLIGLQNRAKMPWRIAIDSVMAISLVLTLWHYSLCKSFLPMQTIAFIVIVTVIIIMWLADYLQSKRKTVLEPGFESTAPVLPELPEAPYEEPKAPAEEEIIEPVMHGKKAKKGKKAPAVEEMPEIPELPPAPEPVVIPPAAVPRKFEPLESVDEEIIEPITPEKKAKKGKKAPAVKIAPPSRMSPEMDAVMALVKRSEKTLSRVNKTLGRMKKKRK